MIVFSHCQNKSFHVCVREFIFSLMVTLGILKEFLCDLFTTSSNRVARLDSCTVMFLDEIILRKQNKNANQYLCRVMLHIPVHAERYN